MKTIKTTLTVLLFAGLTSCKIQQSMPQYLQGATNENIEKNIIVPELVIQKNDLLAIQVYSDYLPEGESPDVLYNQPTPVGGAAVENSSGSTTSTSGGYLVDKNGNIDYPRIGLIKAEGLTKLQLGDEIKKRLTSPKELLKNPTVIVRFQSYKITALGEFNTPQTFTIPTEKINIFEAISMAGGITQWGRKNEVKVIREQNGHRELGVVDLSSPQVFNSPYYFLKQNDIILVDAINEKAKTQDQTTTMSRASFLITVISAVSAITGLVLVFVNNSN
ncbi:MAG: polysaccharide biosynthesis/export family protein [Niabella sp.]